jgi:translocator protein
MLMKISYILIPLVVGVIAFMGSKYTRAGLKSWYPTLRKPGWTPSGKLIREIWIFLYLLVTVALILFWTVTQPSLWHIPLAAVLIVHGYLHLSWTKIFFKEHNLAKAYKRLIYLLATGIVATIIMWPIYLLPALLMLPYLVWLALATKLTKDIWKLNK